MAKSAEQLFDDPDWIFEMKWDGYRAIAMIDKGNVRLNAPVQWVKPDLVCEVAFQESTSDGKMRAPSFLGLRDDKEPKDVVREN